MLPLGAQQLDFKVEPSLVAAEQCPSPGIDILSMTHPCWLLGPFTGIASFILSVGSLGVRVASRHSLHFLLIRKTGFDFFLACRSFCEVGVDWPGALRASHVSLFCYCSLPQYSLLCFSGRGPPRWCWSLAQCVRRLSVVSTNMGRVLLYTLLLPATATYLRGSKSLQHSRAFCLFSCVCWRS